MRKIDRKENINKYKGTYGKRWLKLTLWIIGIIIIANILQGIVILTKDYGNSKNETVMEKSNEDSYKNESNSDSSTSVNNDELIERIEWSMERYENIYTRVSNNLNNYFDEVALYNEAMILNDLISKLPEHNSKSLYLNLALDNHKMALENLRSAINTAIQDNTYSNYASELMAFSYETNEQAKENIWRIK